MPNDPITTNPTAPTPRQLLEQAVACLIEYLDSVDPDPDLEEGGDDEEDPDLEDAGDGEPSLGSLSCVGSMYWGNGRERFGWDQTRWALGNGLDLEDEHDGREPDVDDEPTLGWGADIRQYLTAGYVPDGIEREPSLGWTEWEARSGRYGWLSDSDREEGCEDEGAQCEDEGAEHDGREPDYY